jgi:hypothetical protein
VGSLSVIEQVYNAEKKERERACFNEITVSS